jgi:D-alanyl-D-alanine carboxypeptidase
MWSAIPTPRGAALVRPVLLLALLLLAGCGASQKKNTATNSGNGVTIRLVPSASATVPAAGVALGSPTPAPACAPSDILFLVDKDHALPPDYAPPDLVTVRAPDASPGAPTTVQLRKVAADAMTQMLTDARAQSINLLAQSGYRSYEYQAQVYGNEVQTFGQTQADRESARPGHSEHQLGLAMDFTTRALGYDLNNSFAATPEGRWLAQNAARYGFVLSYPQDKEAITGYTYEPWHYRYIGVDAAQKFLASGLALNQWLGQHQQPCSA